jgi:hypothetical protein
VTNGTYPVGGRVAWREVRAGADQVIRDCACGSASKQRYWLDQPQLASLIGAGQTERRESPAARIAGNQGIVWRCRTPDPICQEALELADDRTKP